MPFYVVIVDLFALVLIVCGFSMAFRQVMVRRMMGRPPVTGNAGHMDPITYVLRIAGTMIMAFGFTLGMMVTLFNLS